MVSTFRPAIPTPAGDFRRVLSPAPAERAGGGLWRGPFLPSKQVGAFENLPWKTSRPFRACREAGGKAARAFCARRGPLAKTSRLSCTLRQIRSKREIQDCSAQRPGPARFHAEPRWAYFTYSPFRRLSPGPRQSKGRFQARFSNAPTCLEVFLGRVGADAAPPAGCQGRPCKAPKTQEDRRPSSGEAPTREAGFRPPHRSAPTCPSRFHGVSRSAPTCREAFSGGFPRAPKRGAVVHRVVVAALQDT